VSGLLTPADIEDRIVRCATDLEDASRDLEGLAESRSLAKYEYEIEFAKARLAAAHKDGAGRNGMTTVDEREDHARINTDEQYKLFLLEDAKYDARKRYAQSLESSLSAWQTLARLIGPQAGLGR